MLKRILVIGLTFGGLHALAEAYGMAGCGLGAVIFRDQPGLVQVVAATTNNFYSTNTSAMSSGTSNCYEANDGGNSASIHYIESNQVALREDAAKGSGETLEGLITLMGCDSGDEVRSALKKDYNSIFSSRDSQAILKAIKSNESVQKSCGSIG